MIFVNYLGHFDAMPWMLKHHRAGYSYADTIAPLFVFVVGMSFRLSFRRRIETSGYPKASLQMLRRYAIIGAIGIVLGHFDFKVDVWDALLDIACAGVLSLPFIMRGAAVRITAAAVYLVVFQIIYTRWGYGDWVVANSIDGGPIGILSWASILLFGTLAADMIRNASTRQIIQRSLAWGLGMSALGWALEVSWGGLKAEWPFTQYGMSSPYALYSVGLCFLTFLAFYLACDKAGLRVPPISILGENALLMYVVQDVAYGIFFSFMKENASALAALASWVGVYLFCLAVASFLHWRKIIVKV